MRIKDSWLRIFLALCVTVAQTIAIIQTAMASGAHWTPV